MSLIKNALKLLCYRHCVPCFDAATTILLSRSVETMSNFGDRKVSAALHESLLRIDQTTSEIKNLAMKKKSVVQRTIRYITKHPQNVIFMWIGNVPKIVRRKIAVTDGSELQSLYVQLLCSIPGSDTRIEVNLIRPMDELFLQTCDKIKERIHKFILKQTKEIICNEESNYEFMFSTPDHPNLLLCTNEQVYRNENIVEIHINNDVYRILRNPPRCTKLALKLKPLVGCPVMPSFTIADDSQKVEPLFHWYIGEADTLLAAPTLNRTSEGESKYSMDGWTYRSTGRYFCPELQDFGKRVCVMLDMGSDATIHCIVSDDVVAKINEPLVFENRQSTYCKQRANDGIRLMSYNVLADLYLDLKQKQDDLYFPYCPKEYQEYAYRYPLLLREIPGYQADIIFLQEVDERLWLRFLPVVMNSHGYDCYFKKKGLKVNEGLVICHRKEHFRHIQNHDIWLPDLLNTELYPENADVTELLENNEELKEMFVSKPAVVQAMAMSSSLSEDTDDILLLANTHLYFDPRHEIIKILQALLCARWIAHTAADYMKRKSNVQLHVLFAGDFNSTPDGAVYQLLSTGNITAKTDCITYSQHLRKDVTFNIRPSSAKFNLMFTNLTDETQVTNYTHHYRYDGQIAGFQGCLDYIWGSTNVEVQKFIPMPPKELVKRYVALPSKISPSDHLPLLCDVKFR